MGPVASRVMITGLLLLFTLASGIWLSHTGKPISVAVLTIHKLIALAMVVSAGLAVHHLSKGADLRVAAHLAAGVTGLCLLSLFGSGALLSIGKLAYLPVLRTHQVMAILVPVCAAVTTYLLSGGRLR